MNNGQLTRWLDTVERRIDQRLREHADAVKADLAEHTKVVNRDVDRIEAKVGDLQAKCVGCAGEFGAVKEKAIANESALKDHQADHRWRFGQATAIAGTVAGIVLFVLKALYDWVRHP